jgi:hypothetical protein
MASFGMTMCRRLGLGAALVAVPVLAFTNQAGADTGGSAGASQDTTFSYEGNRITCEFFGNSSFTWDTSDDRSFISGQSGWGRSFDDPPECNEALQSLQVNIVYRNEDGDFETVSGLSFGDYVSASGSESGQVTDVRASHTVVYDCNNGEICTSSLSTTPK